LIVTRQAAFAIIEVVQLSERRPNVSFGPIELVILRFPGNRFTGEIAPALNDLVENDLVRIIDLIFVKKDVEGMVAAVEVAELEPRNFDLMNSVVHDGAGMLTEEDIERLGELLEPQSTAAVVLFENAWARRLSEAIRNAGGEVLINQRMPRAVIEALLATVAEAASQGRSESAEKQAG
jgi:uncharacterized membrane protein